MRQRMKLPERVVVGDATTRTPEERELALLWSKGSKVTPKEHSRAQELENKIGRRRVDELFNEEARGAKDEGTVTWKTLPKPVHVSKPLQSVALRPGEEKEVYRPRTDKELSSSFGKDGSNAPKAHWPENQREVNEQHKALSAKGYSPIGGAPRSAAQGRMKVHEYEHKNPRLTGWISEHMSGGASSASGTKAHDALPLPVPVKDDRPPLGGLKCQKCGKSVSEKTRQLGGPPLCALHRAIASGSARDDEDGSTFVRAAEKAEQTKQWARASSMYRLAQRAFINQGLMEQAAMAREDADRCAVSWTKAKARDAAPRYKPTDCIYNPPS